MHFSAALFDMDGTLLDSMGVWAQVDEDFFALRGIPVPADYGPNLAGKSFLQSAEYTKERFDLPESIEEIIAEWNALCQAQYERHVPLKPGAARYLRLLKRSGVKLAVATALPEHLFMPALRRNGIADLFDAFTSTEETGTNKITGDVYALAARKLGVANEDCIVFEDILEGHLGARAVGMRSCNVYDRHADHYREQIAAAADYMTRDFVSGVPLPENAARWNRAVIVPSYIGGALPSDKIQPGDCVIAADRGYIHCKTAGIDPDFCIGDFDSLLPGESIPAGALVHPAEKDDTDAGLALKHALSLGLDDVLLLGGIGGRLDHTLANLQLLRFAYERGASLSIAGDRNSARLLLPGVHVLSGDGRFSLFAFTPQVTGLFIHGAKYEMDGAVLTDRFPLGISNEHVPGACARIEFADGMLLLVRSWDD